MKLGLLIVALLMATQAFAENGTATWGCLWVEKNDPGEKLVKWCVLKGGIARVSCYHIDANALAPEENIKPWVNIDADDITIRLVPNEGLCPKLPGNVPDVEIIRGDSIKKP